MSQFGDFENIADILWLSKYIEISKNKKSNISDESKKELNTQEDESISREDSSDLDINGSDEAFKSQIEFIDEEVDSELEIHTDTQNFNAELSHTNQRTASAFTSPKKLSLQNYRKWEQAFKRLNLQKSSFTKFYLDEIKTVEYIASTNIVDIFYKQAEEKVFSLTIIFDMYETMNLWEELLYQFQQLVQTAVVFNKINVFYWDTSQEYPKLYSDKSFYQRLSKRHVLSLNNENIILVMSDCIAPAWKSGQAIKDIDEWAKKYFTSLIQMFPKEMWMGTILHKGKHTFYSSKVFHPRNKSLFSKNSTDSQVLKLPVISFNPDSFNALFNVIIGNQYNKVSSVEFDLDNIQFTSIQNTHKPVISSDQRLRRFYSQASPTAQKLATYMSVLPVNFEITRILQENKLPNSNQSHVAEVFFGGLIKKTTINDKNHYDFYPGIREQLSIHLSAEESYELLESMDQFISSNLDVGFGFSALLSDPSGSLKGDFILDDQSIAFAHIVSNVLKRKGGHYNKISKKIENTINRNMVSNIPIRKAEKESISLIISKIDTIKSDFIKFLILYWIIKKLLQVHYGEKISVGVAFATHIKKLIENNEIYELIRKALAYRNELIHHLFLMNHDSIKSHIENFKIGIDLLSNDLGIDKNIYTLENINTLCEYESYFDITNFISKIDITNIDTIISSSAVKEHSLERLIILHALLDGLLKLKYEKITTMQALTEYFEDYKDDEQYKIIAHAMSYKNTVLHSLDIFNDYDTISAINAYINMINIVRKNLSDSPEFEIKLNDFRIDKISRLRPFTKQELRKNVAEDLGLSIEMIEMIDGKLFDTITSAKHERLKSIVKSLKKHKKITPEKLFEIDSTLMTTIYRSPGKVKQQINSLVNNDLLTNHFANKYFGRRFDILIDEVCKKQRNSDSGKVRNWLFRLAMLEKENAITTDDYRRINELRNTLNLSNLQLTDIGPDETLDNVKFYSVAEIANETKTGYKYVHNKANRLGFQVKKRDYHSKIFSINEKDKIVRSILEQNSNADKSIGKNIENGYPVFQTGNLTLNALKDSFSKIQKLIFKK